MKKMKDINLIYPVGGPTFIHMKMDDSGIKHYNVIELTMTDEDKEVYERVMDKLIEVAQLEPVPAKVEKIGPILLKLLDKVVTFKKPLSKVMERFNSKVYITQKQYEIIKYYLIRNRVGYGKLEALLIDPYLEDVHCTGVGAVQTVHKIFDMVHTNIVFKDHLELDKYIVNTTERVERPASDSHAIIDAMMPDGSRGNFIYGKDVSLEGSSFTLRKFFDVPISITQLIQWGTISSELAAYLWIAMENGMNLFVCGETASGKTTTLNAISAFIKPDDKVYTVENTPEVKMPHACWQHLLTREAGRSSDVKYLDLLIAALRSRPNYIIVGEIRGEEGNIAFQAMQTGHPVMSTFHAGNVTTMIQRVTGNPINVPITFVDNLNLVLIQQAVAQGGHFVRRVLSLTEIERYYEPAKKVVTRRVFEWYPSRDMHAFKGLFNSYILEQKIAVMLGYSNPREIYNELDRRKVILDKMVEKKIFEYYAVWDIITGYIRGGEKNLPFSI